MIPSGRLYQVHLNGEVLGVVIDNGVIVEAPERLLGIKTHAQLQDFVSRRGGSVRDTGWPPVMTDNSFQPRKSDDKPAVLPAKEWFGSGPEPRRRKKRSA